MYAGLIMLAADVADLSKLQKLGLLKTLDFVNFGGFYGFRFLDPPTHRNAWVMASGSKPNNGGLGADPPAGSRCRAAGRG